MKISPKYSTDDWNKLDLSDPSFNNEDWEKAILIFEDRIRGRFLDIVDRIQLETFSGFVVMAIDCLLIDTLEQFYRGVPDSVGGSQSFFNHFFERSDMLKKEFAEYHRKLFYEQFRCGILHQAEIKGDSLVWKVGPLVQNNGNGIIVNRQLFHKILVCEFNNYVQKLRGQNTIDVDLRIKFRTKMDYICRKPQLYFAFREEITEQVMQEQLGELQVVDQATLFRYKKKTNNKYACIGVEFDDDSNVTGTIYRISIEQLDKLTEHLEKDNKPIPLQINCPSLSEYQMVWVYSR